MLKQQEMRLAAMEQKKTQIAVEDLAFEIYKMNAEQTKLKIEIFQNRKLDLYA
jgi:cytochrome bd-type quinol oxidase subunit 1